MLPRGVPQDTPSEGVYEFVGISGFSTGPRLRRSNSDDNVEALFNWPSKKPSRRPGSNSDNDASEEGVDEADGNDESGIEKSEEDAGGEGVEVGDWNEENRDEESVNEEDWSEESGDEESEGSRSASNAHYKSEPTDYQGLCRYNVLLINRNGGAAYHRVALGLIMSDAWERESTKLAYIQLE